MMTCKNCGSELNGTEKFCGACGSAVVRTAPEDEVVPTAASAVMEQEPPEAPGSKGMPEAGKTAPRQDEYAYRYRRPEAEPYVYAQPGTSGDKKDPERVIGMWGYVLSLFLMSLPVAGLVLQIIWACGGTNSLNRRNLARGSLFLWVVRLALAALVVVLCMAIFASWMPYIIERIEYYF